MKWRKSSRSNGNGGNNCVEVAQTDDGMVAVRDSKQNGRKHQAFLIFTPAEFLAFLDGAKSGEFDNIVEPPPGLVVHEAGVPAPCPGQGPVLNMPISTRPQDWAEPARSILRARGAWRA